MSKFVIREDQIIGDALAILGNRLGNSRGIAMNTPDDVRSYASLKLSTRKQEVFAVLLLDNQNRLLMYAELFYGSVNSCAVYPREVLRLCVEYNAASIILMHNHPSGVCEPSRMDKEITKTLVNLLHVIDVSVHDHLIAAGNQCYSFAEHGVLPSPS